MNREFFNYNKNMLDKIQLDDQPFDISVDQLPCLISYSEKTGGSHFSVSFIADLFLSGSKILFLTAYPMATENFLKQVNDSGSSITQIESLEDLRRNIDTQVIMIKSGDEEFFMEVVDSLTDIDERIVFVKNIETFKQDTVKRCLGLEKVILSGDIDKCELKEEILKKTYTTTVLFGLSKIDPFLKVPPLKKYTGYLRSKDVEGVVKLKIC